MMIRTIVDWLKADTWRTISLGLVVVIAAVLVSSLGSQGEPVDAPQDGTLSIVTTTTSGSAGEDDSVVTTIGVGDTTTGKAGFLAVKIDNAPGAWPLVGIGGAPLLVEVPVEGGMTRFIAVFADDVSGVVGPVRSLRPVDADLLPTLAINIVSTGGQPFVVQEVEATGIQHLSPFLFDLFVSGGREAPHDTFLDVDLLMSMVRGSGEVAPGLPVGDLPEPAGEASTIQLPNGGVEFRFDGGSYARFESGAQVEVLDTLGGQLQPLSRDTVIVMFAAERPAGYVDSNGVVVVDFDVIGRGDLLVFNGGKVYDGSWSRSALVDPYVFFDDSGRPFGLPEVPTHLAIVPRDLQVVFD